MSMLLATTSTSDFLQLAASLVVGGVLSLTGWIVLALLGIAFWWWRSSWGAR